MTDGSTGGRTGGHVEPGGSWRPFWLVGAGLVVLLVLEAVLAGGDVPPLVQVLCALAVLVVGGGVHSARRPWTVRVGGAGPDSGLPLRLTDGRTVLVPTRDPAALAAAVLAGIGGRSGDTPEGGTASRGTLAP